MLLKGIFAGVSAFALGFEGVDAIHFDGIERLEKESHAGFRAGSLVSYGGAHVVGSGSKFESEACDLETLAHAYLYKGSGRQSAGFASVGGEGTIEYIHVIHESRFIYMPDAPFKQLVGAIDSIAPSTRHHKMVVFPESSLKKLPTIYIQFSKTNIQYNISPAAYSRCETKGAASKRMCVLLVKRTIEDFWVLGRPFTDNVLTVLAIGSDPESFLRVCVPRKAVNSAVTGQTVDTTRRLPYSTNDFLIGAALGILLLIIFWWFFGDRIAACCKGKRNPGQNAPAAIPVVEGRPVNVAKKTKAKSEDKEPLINKEV